MSDVFQLFFILLLLGWMAYVPFFFLIPLFSNSKYGIRISSCPKCGLPLFITGYYYMIINIVFDFLFNLEGVIFIISQMTFVWRGVAGRSPAVQTTLSFVFLLVLMISMQRLPRRWRYLFLTVNNSLKTKGIEGNEISKADTQWPLKSKTGLRGFSNIWLINNRNT